MCASMRAGTATIHPPVHPEGRSCGPRAIEGLRRLTGRATGGMIAPVLKPMGLSPQDFARLAAGCVRGGADIVKEDHGLAGQPTAPFRARVEAAFAAVERADALLVAGSSLTVWSGLRFVRRAAERGIPIASVNLGPTRADDLFSVNVQARVGDVLPALP